MTIPVHVAELLEEVEDGDPTALGYTIEELDEKRYFVPDNLPRSAPAPFFIPSARKVPTYNQQGGTCVGNSIGSYFTHAAFQEHGEVFMFDGEALNARVTHEYDKPTSFRPILDDILKSGISPLGDEGLFFPAGYANVDYHDAEAVRNAISTPGQMCVFATFLTKEFVEARTPKVALPARPGEQGMGLHAMGPLIGYDNDGPYGQNNWGVGFADQGITHYSWDYVNTHFVEIMAITDKPDVAGGYIKTHQYFGYDEHAIKRFDLPNRKRPATYLVKDNGLIWIKDPTEAKRFGVKLPATAVADSDDRWGLPIIGPDAPKQYR